MKTNVRMRGDRVSAGVLEACAYDQEADRLVNFDQNKFQARSASHGGWQQRAVAEAPAPYRPNPTPPSTPPPSGGPGGPNGGSRQTAPAARPSHLSVVARTDDEDAPPPSREPIEDTGDHRLVVEMEETTDEAADLRRVRRVCAVLDDFAGDLPVELRVKTRGGQVVSLARGAVNGAELERIVARLRPILGVLGGAHEAGSTVQAGQLAAVGG